MEIEHREATYEEMNFENNYRETLELQMYSFSIIKTYLERIKFDAIHTQKHKNIKNINCFSLNQIIIELINYLI